MSFDPRTARLQSLMRRVLWRSLLCVAASFALPAHAQTHQKSAGGYMLRSSVVATGSVSAQSLADQGIEPAPHRALLNVVVLKNGTKPRPTVPAEVEVHVRTLSGSRRAIDMKAVKANERVSYVGVIDHAARETLNFEIKAKPQGAPKPVRLEYRERMAP